MSAKYTTIFFDLDHTLWDYKKNSNETLQEIYSNNNLYQMGGFSCEDFILKFEKVNEGLWRQFNLGAATKEDIRTERFKRILNHFKVKNTSLSNAISEQYLAKCPTKTNLFPFTHEVLTYLKEKYTLFVLTNGFNDVQAIKLSNSSLTGYFTGVITSETIGYKKPNKEIFEYALSTSESAQHEAVMIGDNLEADILGAQNAAIDAIYFNPQKQKHNKNIQLEINCLSELMNIL